MLDLAQLYFQPQVTADGHQCVGAEALLRARGVDGRIAGPKAILLMAESEADEDALDWWVIENACRAVKCWPGKTVSVNISTRQFRKPQFSARLLRSLLDWEVDPRALELELLEDGVIEDFDRAIETMRVLRQAGVRIALDDFGTGMSSLSYLRRLPIDKLKIDKSLIEDIADIKSAAIVQAITAMARSMGIKVIAEGVETAVQKEFLRITGCHQLQGFYFSPAVPADEFSAMLARGWPAARQG